MKAKIDYKQLYEKGLKYKLLLQDIEIKIQQNRKQIQSLLSEQRKLGQDKDKLNKNIIYLFE